MNLVFLILPLFTDSQQSNKNVKQSKKLKNKIPFRPQVNH